LHDLLSDIQSDCPHHLLGEAQSALEAIDQICVMQPDIVLLDVQMPGMNGLELARHLQDLARKQSQKMPAIIFVTAYDEFALKAFEVHAFDYLLKPVRASRLADALNRIRQLHRSEASVSLSSLQESKRHAFSVMERNRVLLIPLSEVLYLRAEQKYVTLHTKDRSFLLEDSLTSIELEMEEHFVRVHRNALVSRSALLGVERATHAIAEHEGEKSTESWQVIIRDCDERLPISRRQWPIIKALVR